MRSRDDQKLTCAQIYEHPFSILTVMPAWADAKISPNLLILKYPCPPQRSRQVVAVLFKCQAVIGLIAQHILTTFRWLLASSLGLKAQARLTEFNPKVYAYVLKHKDINICMYRVFVYAKSTHFYNIDM